LVLAVTNAGCQQAIIDNMSNTEVIDTTDYKEQEMYLRIATKVVLGALGAFMVVASQVFSSGLAGWLMLIVAVFVFFGVAFDHSTNLAGNLVDAATGLLALWSIAASAAFSGSTLKWLSFAEAAILIVLAIAGLVVLGAARLISSQAVDQPRSPSGGASPSGGGTAIGAAA